MGLSADANKVVEGAGDAGVASGETGTEAEVDCCWRRVAAAEEKVKDVAGE